MTRQRFQTNMNAIETDQNSFRYSNSEFYQLSDGTHTLRILPAYSEAGKFYQKYGVHMPPGRGDLSKKVVCMDFTFDQHGQCAICAMGEQVRMQDGKDAAKNYKYKKKAYLNVLDMKKRDGKVYILDAPSSVMDYILNFLAEEKNDDLIDPNIGYNVRIRRYKAANGFTEYEVQIVPKPCDLDQELAADGQPLDVDGILASLIDLENQVKVPTEQQVDECLSLVQAGGGEDAQADNDFPPPAPRSNARPPVRSPAMQAGDDPTPRTIRSQPAATRPQAGAPAARTAPAAQARTQPAQPARTAPAATRPAAGTQARPVAGQARPAATQPAAAVAQARKAPASTKVAVRTKPQPQAPPPVEELPPEEELAEGEFEMQDFGPEAGGLDDMPNFDDNGEEIPF